MKFIHLTMVTEEWSGHPSMTMVSVNADSVRYMTQRKKPEWLDVGPPFVTHIQLSGEGNQWVSVTESIEEIEALLA